MRARLPANASPLGRSGLPRVTGVRHWSTPDYTRVAIDVEQEVKFDSQRISHPDRIFFDLRDTRLASTLVGKTFDVDDGFLKKIRVAEFQPGRTRIVLEVDDLASYDAFLLPDPYRLIIDIHGKDIHGKDRAWRTAPDAGSDRAPYSKLSDGDAPSATPGRHAAADGDATVSHEPAVAETGPQRSTAGGDRASCEYPALRRTGTGRNRLAARGVSARIPSRPTPAKPANGIGVIKTTVAVKGSNRKNSEDDCRGG